MLYYLTRLFLKLCRFPVDTERRKQWIAKVRRLDPITGDTWQPGPGATVCSEHFLESDFYYQWGRKMVKEDSIPTVFSYEPPVKKRKLPKECGNVLTSSTGAAAVSNLPRRESGAACVSNLPTHQENSASMSNLSHRENSVPTFKCPVTSDHSYAIGSSPRYLRAANTSLLHQLQIKISQLRNARRRENRLRGKLSDILERLHRLQLLSADAKQLLSAYKDIPIHMFTGRACSQFSTEQRQFATTLHYYSPAAYQYLRRHFKLLPSPRTVRDWMSSFNGQPGYTEQSFKTIATKTGGVDAWSYKVCALQIDEMEIKKHLEYDRRSGQVYGFTDIGAGMPFSLMRVIICFIVSFTVYSLLHIGWHSD